MKRKKEKKCDKILDTKAVMTRINRETPTYIRVLHTCLDVANLRVVVTISPNLTTPFFKVTAVPLPRQIHYYDLTNAKPNFFGLSKNSRTIRRAPATTLSEPNF